MLQISVPDGAGEEEKGKKREQGVSSDTSWRQGSHPITAGLHPFLPGQREEDEQAEGDIIPFSSIGGEWIHAI